MDVGAAVRALLARGGSDFTEWKPVVAECVSRFDHPVLQDLILEVSEELLADIAVLKGQLLLALVQHFPTWEEEVALLFSRLSPEVLGAKGPLGRSILHEVGWMREGFGRRAMEAVLQHVAPSALLARNRKGEIPLSAAVDALHIAEDVLQLLYEATPEKGFWRSDAWEPPLYYAVTRAPDALFLAIAEQTPRAEYTKCVERAIAWFQCGGDSPVPRIAHLFEQCGRDEDMFSKGNPLLAAMTNETSSEVVEWLLQILSKEEVLHAFHGKNVIHHTMMTYPWHFSCVLRTVESYGEEELARTLSELVVTTEEHPDHGNGLLFRAPVPVEKTSLMIAVTSKSKTVYEPLLELMADVCPASITATSLPAGATALHFAVWRRRPSLVAMLLPYFSAQERKLKTAELRQTAEDIALAQLEKKDTVQNRQIVAMLQPVVKKAL